MKRKTIPLACLFFLFQLISCTEEKVDFSERETSFNADWKFLRTDVAQGEQPKLDDAAWRTVTVPHDFSIEDLAPKEGVEQIGPFSKESPGTSSTGHVMGGTAWYRKHFILGKSDEGKTIKVLFDGVYMNADVWINGAHLGNHPYGYTAFSFDLTPHLKPAGEENVLAVQVKNEGKNSRWYSGSGIYRNVTLIKTAPVHVAIWGKLISTPRVSNEKALVKVAANIQNESSAHAELIAKVTVKDPTGNIVASGEQPILVSSGTSDAISLELEVNTPSLWSVESPSLYSAEVQLVKNGKSIDETSGKFGIRNIEFSPEKGFELNGETVLLKGACLHHDNGILGSAAFERAEYRKVQIMKKNGYNAIRTAHNPPSKAFLDACDELGMLVIDESFDQWQRPKNDQDYNLYFDEWWARDMESMLLRDRNHPSIIAWSFGNEINERADSSGLEIAQKLIAKIHELDPTRPVTQAICKFWDHPGREWAETAPAFELLDIHGYNYKLDSYEEDHELHPERIMFGSESIPMEAFENWQLVEAHPYVIGDFVWTGMDYFGEAGLGRSENWDTEKEEWMGLPDWPWYNAYCGDIDVLGNKKPQSYFRDVVWGESKLEMAVHEPVPAGKFEHVSYWGWPAEEQSWNWAGHEGEPLPVSVYSRCEEVRLELNGKVVGTKPVSEETKLTAKFEVPFQPGELVAVGLVGGKEVARKSLKTTGKPFQLKLSPERESVSASSNDLAYFNVEVLDENGLLVPDAEVVVTFDLTGDGDLQAVGNGKPTDLKSFQQSKLSTFKGKCQLIVRSSEKAKVISLSASSDGLASATSSVRVGE